MSKLQTMKYCQAGCCHIHIFHDSFVLHFGFQFDRSMYFYTDEHQKPKSFGFDFCANEKEVNLLVLSPNKEVINYNSKMTLTVNVQKIDSELSVLTNKPIMFNFEAKDWNSFTFSNYVKGIK